MVRERTRRRIVVLGVIPALVLTACTSADEPGEAIRVTSTSCPAVSLVRSGDQQSGIYAGNDRGTWKLTGAVWRDAPQRVEYPIRSEAWIKGCIEGGSVDGDVPRWWTRDMWYDGEDGGTRLGGDAFRQTMTRSPGNFLRIRDAHVQDYEDAYDPNSPVPAYTTYLEHVSAKFIRDDCIENEDVPHTMVVRDSFLNGCFTAFAERPKGSRTARNGRGPQSFTVEHSLVAVRPQRLGPNYCNRESVREGRCRRTGRPGVWLGSYGIWKWSDQAAGTVTVRDTIFRVDMPSYSSCQAQRWPVGTYDDVTLVWLGRGRYRTAGDCVNRLPDGVRLTTDVRVWRAAAADWQRDR
jgi:hypothetical protein